MKSTQILFGFGLACILSISAPAQEAPELFFGGNFMIGGKYKNDLDKLWDDSKLRAIQYHIMPQAGIKIGSNYFLLAFGYQKERTLTEKERNSYAYEINKSIFKDVSVYTRLAYSRDIKITPRFSLVAQLNLDYLRQKQFIFLESYVPTYDNSGLFSQQQVDLKIDYFNPSLSIGARVLAGKSVYLEILYGKVGYRWDLEKDLTSKGSEIDFTINTLTLGVKYVIRKEEKGEQ